MSDSFSDLLKETLKQIEGYLSGIWTSIERKTYEKLVECLKYRDEIAVKEAITGLVNEGKKLAIPPLYLTSQKHPNSMVRKTSWDAIGMIESYDKINELTKGKEIKVAVKDLIAEYGNYKDNFK